MKKTYWALLTHPWEGETIKRVTAPLKKNILKSGERMVFVSEEGKEAETEFKLLENFATACLVEVSPKTGRTHQIRVHSAFLGHPIIGDIKYGKDSHSLDLLKKTRLYLHARAVQFDIDNKTQRYQANLDKVFIEALTYLRTGD